MKYLSLLLITLMFSNCQGTKNVKQNNQNTPFETIAQSAYGGKESKSYEIIRSQAEMQKGLENMQLDEKTRNQLNKIDFETHIILVLHAGTFNTGGYGIEVTNVEINGATSYVTLQLTEPEIGEPVTMALTNPYTIVSIDKNETIIFK